ncbi:MAG: hypothetical protein ACE5HU_06870 [Acidobacteriota bacterium]
MMTCHDIEEVLEEPATEGIEGERRRELDRHIATCGNCRELAAAQRSLRSATAALPRHIPPARDLWPAILAAHEKRDPPAAQGRGIPHAPRWRAPRLAASAAVLVVCSAGIIAWFVRPAAGPGHLVPPRRVATAGPALPDLGAAEEEFARATRRLLHARRDELSSETLALLERNLSVINNAIAQTRVVLEREPRNTGAARVLTSLYHRKLDLLRMVTRIPPRA